MSNAITNAETFQPLQDVAVQVGVPSAWLRAEVVAGRVPHLRVGRRILLNLEATAKALLERATGAAKDGTTDAR